MCRNTEVLMSSGAPPPFLRDDLEDLDVMLLHDLCDNDDNDELLHDVDSAVALMAPMSAPREAAVDSPLSSPAANAPVTQQQSLRDLADAVAESASTPAQLFNALVACLELELHSATPPSSPSSRCSASASPGSSNDLLMQTADPAASGEPASCLLAAADWRLPRLARSPAASPAPARDAAWALGATCAAAPLLRSSSLTVGAALPAWAAPYGERPLKRSLSDPTNDACRSSKQPKRSGSNIEGAGVARLERQLHRDLARKAQQRHLAQERLALLQQQPPAAMGGASSSCWPGAWQGPWQQQLLSSC